MNNQSSSSYAYYLQIYNLTTGTTIKSSATVTNTSYSYNNFTCSKGDVIVISLYRYNTNYYYYSTAYFYFSGFGSPAASTATAQGGMYIGSKAFYNCSNLTSVTIGNNVTSIGSHAFYNCSKLTKIVFTDTSTWYRTTNSSDWRNKTNGTGIWLDSSSSNATYFKSTYCDFYWYKL